MYIALCTYVYIVDVIMRYIQSSVMAPALITQSEETSAFYSLEQPTPYTLILGVWGNL